MPKIPFQLVALSFSLILLASIAAQSEAPQGALLQGPVLLQRDATQCELWFRFDREGRYQVELSKFESPEPTNPVLIDLIALEKRDFCATIRLRKLHPDTLYGIRLLTSTGSFMAGSALFVRTPPRRRASTRLVFASCADENEATGRVLERIGEDRPDALVLLGDTPYIDTTRLSVQRRRYREFAGWGALARVVRRTPLYSIWDDHDFGRNDSDGNLPGKENSRRAFIEYRRHPNDPGKHAGIYQRFSCGAAEVFLLDTRTFAATEDSSAAPGTPTLLGKDQWQWLTESLRKSRAPFKILACGMIWNGAVRPGKPDHWASYPAEREALFRFIGEEKISGVVLIGGDIHRSRHLSHLSEKSAGYRLHEFISSPMHGRIIGAANQPHPGLLWDQGAPYSYLRLDVSAKELKFQFRNRDAKTLHEGTLNAAALVFREFREKTARDKAAMDFLRQLMGQIGNPADFGKVETHVRAHPRLSGPFFSNAALACASWLMGKNQFARARSLYLRLRQEPHYRGQDGVLKVLDAQIALCDRKLGQQK
ncbi:MAG: alkaline phosphatase D family protein [Planctomycetota bacterium]